MLMCQFYYFLVHYIVFVLEFDFSVCVIFLLFYLFK